MGRMNPPWLTCFRLTNVSIYLLSRLGAQQLAVDIFQTHRQQSEVDAEEAAESLYDLVEKAPSYWQDLNEPVDRVLTT